MYTRVPEPPDVMRIFVRNRQRYAPGPPSRWITIEVTDFAGTHISHIKEMCKKQMPMAKVDELFYKGQRLADENSIGFYQGRFRLENNAIFETTSNPFWSACMLVCIKDAEQEAAAKPNCRDTQNWTRKTIIHRAAALGVLYNSNNQHQRQPPPLETIDELESFLASHGKKELTMSRFTRLKLEKFHKELMYEYINRMDPIGAFVHAHAVELGFRTDEQDDTVENFMNNNGMFRRRAMNPRGGGASGRGRGRGGGVGGAGPAGGGAIDAGDHGRGRGVNARGGRQARQSNSTGRRNRPVICADCETEIATVYCKDCEQGLALCHECSQRIHQGATRRRHQISDISEAPRVSSYTPKSFKAPFALLVALHYGIQEHPPLLSMTADEVKLRAQVYTDTDLWNKTAGRFFGGFDSMDKTLEKLGFVQKEGAQRSRYALQEAGKPLARKCAQFNEAVDRLYTQHRIPRAPDQYRAVSRAGTVCLLIDRHEPLRDRLLSMAREKNMPAIVRELPVGDFLWIALPVNVDIRYYNGDMPHREMVLPHIVERKTWDDLQDSMSTNRFKNQIKNMKLCELQDLFYLMEGSVFDMKTKPTPEQQIRLQNELLRLQIRDGFLVSYTGSWLKTVQWLLQLTTMATKLHESGVNDNLMSFAEFDELVKVNRRLPPPEDEQLQMRSGTLFKLNGTHFVEMIFSDFQNEVNFADAVSADVPSVPMRHRMQRNRSLLVIENLREYNKERQKLLDRALAAYINHPTPTVPAQEIVETALRDSVHELIHFDAFTYWQLWMQVHIGVSVCRTETADETQKVQRLYEEHHRQASTRRQPYPGQHNGDDDHDDDDHDDGDDGGHGNGGNRYQTHGRNQRRSNQRKQTETDDLSPRLDHRDLPINTDNDVDGGSDANINDNQDSGGTFTTEDFAQDSQSEDAMLQQVIALSTENSVNDEEQMRLALELSKGERRSSRQSRRRNDATAGNSDTVQEDEMIGGTRFSAESVATAAEKSPRQQEHRSPGSTRKSTIQVATGNSINSDDTAAGRKRRSPRQVQHDENSRETRRQQDDDVSSRYSSSTSVTRDEVKSPRQQRSRSPRGSQKSANHATPKKRHNSNDATRGKKTPSPAQMQRGESSETTASKNTKSPRMRGRKRTRQTDPTSSSEAIDGIAIVQDLEDEDLKRALQLSLEENQKVAKQSIVESEETEDEDLKRAIELSLMESMESADGAVAGKHNGVSATHDSSRTTANTTHEEVMIEHDKADSEVMASHDRAMVAHDKVTTAHGNTVLDDTLEDATMMSVDESEEPEDDNDGCQKLPDGERETNKTLLKSTPESQTDVSTISSLQDSMSTEKSKGDGNKPGGRCNSSSQNTEENRCDSTPQTSDYAQIKSEPVANVTEPDLMTSGQSFKEGAPSSPLPDTLILGDDSSFSSTSQLCSGTELVEEQQLKTKEEPLGSPKVEQRDISPDNVEHLSQPLDFEGETLSYNFSLSNPIEENEYTQQDSDETQVDSATSLNAQKPDHDGQSEHTVMSSSQPNQLSLSDECAKITYQESLSSATNVDTSTAQNLASGISVPSSSNHSAIKNSTAGHLGDPSMETAIDLTDSQESEIDLTKSLSDSQESLYVYDGDDIIPVTASQSDDIITKSNQSDDIIMVTGPGCSNSKKGSGTISVSASRHKNRGKVNDIIPVTASQKGKTGKPTCGKVNDEDSVFSLISAPEKNAPSVISSVLETTVPQDNRVGVVTPTRQKRSSGGSHRGRKGSGSTEKPGTDAIMVVEDAEFAKVLQLSKQEYEKNQQKPGAEKHGIDCTDSGDLTEPSRQCLTDEEFARLLQRQFEFEVNHTGTTLQTRSTTSDGVQWQEIIDAAARKDTSRFDSRSTTPNTGSRRRQPTPTKRGGSIETDSALMAKKRKTEEDKDFEIALRYHSIINNKGSDDSGTLELDKQKTQNKPTPSKLSAINQQKQIAEYRKQMQEQYKHRHTNNTPQKSASPHSSALGNPSTLPSRSSDWSSQTRPSAAVLPRTSSSRIVSLSGSLAMSSTPKSTASSASTSSQKHSTPSAAVSSTSGIWSLSHTVPAAAINLSDDDDDDDFPDLSDRMRKASSSTFGSSSSLASFSKSPASTAWTSGVSSSVGTKVDSTASPPPVVQHINRQANTTCGNCKEKGHNRSSKQCPMYYSESEVARRKERTDKLERQREEENRRLERMEEQLRRGDRQVQQIRNQLLTQCNNIIPPGFMDELKKIINKKRKKK